MRAVQAFPVTGVVAQVMMAAALAATVGLSDAAWVVGVGCGVITNAALARGVLRYRPQRLGPADWVTLTRATLAYTHSPLLSRSEERLDFAGDRSLDHLVREDGILGLLE